MHQGAQAPQALLHALVGLHHGIFLGLDVGRRSHQQEIAGRHGARIGGGLQFTRQAGTPKVVGHKMLETALGHSNPAHRHARQAEKDQHQKRKRQDQLVFD